MTQMLREILEIPAVVERQVTSGADAYREEGERLRQSPPRFVLTCARGSSDQAASYFKYLAEVLTGVPVASIGPSVASVYDAALRLEGGVMFTVSQSGGSPDLVSAQAHATKGGGVRLRLSMLQNLLLRRRRERRCRCWPDRSWRSPPPNLSSPRSSPWPASSRTGAATTP